MVPAKLIPVVCIFCAAVLAQPAGRGVISGTVIEAVSGDPVRKATVTVTWQGTPRSWATIRTDGSGRFTFEGLPPGKYGLHADKPGMGTANYGSNSTRELSDFITLGDGEIHGDIKLRFLRSATISGRVLDPDGDPLPGVQVTMLRQGRNLGEKVLVNAVGASTNDRGEYKITGAAPGEYFLRCAPNNGPRFPGLSQQVVGSRYYGGSRESKDATPIHLRGSEVLTGIDFHLTAERPATITGRVTGVPAIDPPAEVDTSGPVENGRFAIVTRGRRMMHGNGDGVTVELTPAGNDQMFWGNAVTAVGPDYKFEMPDSIPGRYRLQATIRVKEKTYYATQFIDVRDGTTDVMLSMAPAVDIKGHVHIEGPGSHPLESMNVVLNTPGSRNGSHNAAVKKDGSFVIEQVPPGEWALNVNPNQVGIFEKSVMLGDKDYLYKRIEIPPGLDAPLNIVLSSNLATVEGTVDTGGADAKRAGILLEPVGKWHDLARFYYQVLADEAGKFKLNRVAPGRYKIFALEKISTGGFLNPESAELLEAALKDQVEEFDVPEGGKIQVNPKLVPEERAKEILKP
jgi:protocatechuate 3,4-dioxygenase beta subunit